MACKGSSPPDALPPTFTARRVVVFEAAPATSVALRSDPAVESELEPGPYDAVCEALDAGWTPVVPLDALPALVDVVGRLGKGRGGDTWLARLLPAHGRWPVVIKRPRAQVRDPDIAAAVVAGTLALPTAAGFAYLAPTAHITVGMAAGGVRVNPTHNGYREAVLGRALTAMAVAGATPHIGFLYRAVPTDMPYVLHMVLEPGTMTLREFLGNATATGATTKALEAWVRVALAQVFQALLAAHCAYGFRHNDLHADNVVLQQGRAVPTAFRYVLDTDGTAVVVPTLGMVWKVIDFQWGSSDRLLRPKASEDDVGPGTDHAYLMDMRQAAHAKDHATERCKCRHPGRPYLCSQAAFDAELLVQSVFLVLGAAAPGCLHLHDKLVKLIQRLHREWGFHLQAGDGVKPDADPGLARRLYRALVQFLAAPWAEWAPPSAEEVPVVESCRPPPGADLFSGPGDRMVHAAWTGRGDAALEDLLASQGLSKRTWAVDHAATSTARTAFLGSIASTIT